MSTAATRVTCSMLAAAGNVPCAPPGCRPADRPRDRAGRAVPPIAAPDPDRLAAGGRQRTSRACASSASRTSPGRLAPGGVPARPRPRARAERLLLRRPLRGHGGLLRLALPPLAARLPHSSATASSPRPRSRCSIHWRFPTAPPRLAGMGLVDTLRQLSGHRHRLAAPRALLESGRGRAVAPRRLGARRRGGRRRSTRGRSSGSVRRRALPASRRADDRRDREPLRPRRGRRHRSSMARRASPSRPLLRARRCYIAPATRGGAVR